MSNRSSPKIPWQILTKVVTCCIFATGLLCTQAQSTQSRADADVTQSWSIADGKAVRGKLLSATTKSITIQAAGGSERNLTWSSLTEADRDKARTLLLVLEDPAPRVPSSGVYTRIYPITRQTRDALPETTEGKSDFASLFRTQHIDFDTSVATGWQYNGMQLVVTQTPSVHNRVAALLWQHHLKGARTSEHGALPVTGIEAPEFDDIDRIILKYIKHTEEEAIMLAVMYSGRLVYRAAYGWANEARTMPLDPDNRSLIASIIKPMTSRAINKLLEDHNIDRDAKVMPILKLKPLRGHPFAKGVDQITINHLLSHRSGMVSRLPNLDYVGKTLRLGRDANEGEMFAYHMSRPLKFQPGKGKHYSNSGYKLLGALMAAVTGTSAAQYMQDTQMTPHGAYSLVPPYHNLVYPPASWVRYSNPCAGSAVMTAPDYLRWFSRYDPDRAAPPPRGRKGTLLRFRGKRPGKVPKASATFAILTPRKQIRFALIQFQRGKKRKPESGLPRMLEKKLREMVDWPDHNLFEIPDPRAKIPR